MSRGFCTFLALVSISIAPAFASAAPYMFATFSESGGNQPFSFTASGSVGTMQALSVPVDFEFTAPTGLGTQVRAATLNLNPSGAPTFISAPMYLNGWIDLTQCVSITTLSITENSTGKNLLTMDFTCELLGRSGGSNAFIFGSDTDAATLRQFVNFTSDYLTFPEVGTDTPTGNSFNLGLETTTPVLSMGSFSLPNNFTANLNGMFSANATPEPASLALLGLGATALLRRRRR